MLSERVSGAPPETQSPYRFPEARSNTRSGQTPEAQRVATDDGIPRRLGRVGSTGIKGIR